MTEAWTPGPEWIAYDGSNGEDIAAAMSTNGRDVIVNPDHQGPALSLSERRTQVLNDRWRVPAGYYINPTTGECRNADGVPQDWDALTAEG